MPVVVTASADCTTSFPSLISQNEHFGPVRIANIDDVTEMMNDLKGRLSDTTGENSSAGQQLVPEFHTKP